MASLRISANQLVCVSKENIIVYDIGSTEKHVYQSTPPKQPDQEEKQHKPQGTEEGSLTILACGFSRSGRYFVGCDDYKQVTTWKVSSDGTWDRLSTRAMSARRATTLTFTQDEATVLIGDKSGDVYSFSISNPHDPGELLLGHVSMLLDLALLDGDGFLATSDRDEKIRISNFPNAYSINGFCLGHTAFVSCLGYFATEDVLVSGSGDGTLRLWNYKSGTQLYSTDCRRHLEAEIANTQAKTTKDNERQGQGHEDMEGTEGQGHASQDVSNQEGKFPENKALAHRLQTNEGLDLKCFDCCEKRKLVAVGFDRLLAVLVYKLEHSVGPMTLTLVSKVSLEGALWDLTFDLSEKCRLLLLCSNQSKPLSVYVEGDNKVMALTEDADTDRILVTSKALAQEWDLLKSSLDQDNVCSVLHKIRVDTTDFNIERKQKLDEQKQRYKTKSERRKRAKDVLPPGECKEEEQDSIVAPPSEYSDNSSKQELPLKKVKNDS